MDIILIPATCSLRAEPSDENRGGAVIVIRRTHEKRVFLSEVCLSFMEEKVVHPVIHLSSLVHDVNIINLFVSL